MREVRRTRAPVRVLVGAFILGVLFILVTTIWPAPQRLSTPSWASAVCRACAQSDDTEALLRDLDSRDRSVRKNAALRLRERGPRALFATSALAKRAVNDEDRYVRLYCLTAIRAIGPEAANELDSVVKALKDSYWRARLEAIRCIRDFGPDARRLVEVLNDHRREAKTVVEVLEAAHAADRISVYDGFKE